MTWQITERVCIRKCSRLVAESGGQQGKSNFFNFFFPLVVCSNVLEPVPAWMLSLATHSSVQVTAALLLYMKIDKNIRNDLLEQASVRLGPALCLWKCNKRCYSGRAKSGCLKNRKHNSSELLGSRSSYNTEVEPTFLFLGGFFSL